MLKNLKKQRKVKQVVASLMVIVCLLTCSFSSVFAATTLTDAQKATLISDGFPSTRSTSLQAYYDDFVDYCDYYSYGSSTAFGAFDIFVSNMANITSLSGQEDFAIVARGYYSEISGHSGYYQTELYHIVDSIMNRYECTHPDDSSWNDSILDAAQSAMNAINPDDSGYCTGDPVKKPLYDSALYQEARIALIHAYMIAWDQVGVTYSPSSARYSDLPDDYCFFNETYAAGRHNAGYFYFRSH